MNLDFNTGKIATTTFGVGRRLIVGPSFSLVPARSDVQDKLKEMLRATITDLGNLEQEVSPPKEYDPSDKPGGKEYLYLPTGVQIAKVFRNLHNADNLDLDSNALRDTNRIFCYFARFTDDSSRKLIAMRRASQFKTLRKPTITIMSLMDDTVRIATDPLFRLDSDFDLLIDSNQVHILRPGGFENIGELKKQILLSVPANIAAIADEISYVDWRPIQEYAGERIRAARYLASIRAQGAAQQVGVSELMQLCRATNVDVTESNGELAVAEGHIMGFLEVLDRRRYTVELVPGSPERFRASSRESV